MVASARCQVNEASVMIVPMQQKSGEGSAAEERRVRLARTWLRYQRTEDERRWWAVSRVQELADDDPNELWEVTLELVRLADAEELLCQVGAGPLEVLVRYDGKEFIERIVSKARGDPKFRVALSCVWVFESTFRLQLDQVLDELGEPRR